MRQNSFPFFFFFPGGTETGTNRCRLSLRSLKVNSKNTSLVRLWCSGKKAGCTRRGWWGELETDDEVWREGHDRRESLRASGGRGENGNERVCGGAGLQGETVEQNVFGFGSVSRFSNAKDRVSDQLVKKKWELESVCWTYGLLLLKRRVCNILSRALN